MKLLRSVLTAMTAVMVTTALLGGCVPDGGGGPRTVGVDCATPPRLVSGASLFGCDLAGLDLSGLDLSGSNLSGANLSGSNLSGANLRQANLEGANLTGADLTGADLTGAILAGAILLGALFVNAILNNASFDFGRVFGATGTGGGVAVGGTGGGATPGVCSGPYCPGYNESTVDTGDLLCSPDLGELTGGEYSIHRSTAQLVESGQRSVVTDATTSFRGASFVFSNQDDSIGFLRGLSLGRSDFTNATFANVAMMCQRADGARFSGASIVGTPHSGLYYMSFRNSDFRGSILDNVDIDEATFAGSNASGARWSDLDLQLVEELDSSFNDGTPAEMLDLSGVDFRGSILGLAPDGEGNQGLGFGGLLREPSDPPTSRSTAWRSADLRGAVITDLVGIGNDFTGALTAGLTVRGTGSVAGATFDAGWLGVDWTGDYDFSGATCPDGSIGVSGLSCF